MDEVVARELLRRIRSRVTVESFDPDRELTDDEIRELVADACEAPSSFNMQHWRFIAVRRPEDKAILAEAAYGQRQVVDAAVTFILLGDLNSVEHLGETRFVGGRDDVVVAHRSAGLNDRRGARFQRRQQSVGERKKRVRRNR